MTLDATELRMLIDAVNGFLGDVDVEYSPTRARYTALREKLEAMAAASARVDEQRARAIAARGGGATVDAEAPIDPKIRAAAERSVRANSAAFRRILPQLLAQGDGGKWAVIHFRMLQHIDETEAGAHAWAHAKFGAWSGRAIHQIVDEDR